MRREVDARGGVFVVFPAGRIRIFGGFAVGVGVRRAGRGAARLGESSPSGCASATLCGMGAAVVVRLRQPEAVRRSERRSRRRSVFFIYTAIHQEKEKISFSAV